MIDTKVTLKDTFLYISQGTVKIADFGFAT